MRVAAGLALVIVFVCLCLTSCGNDQVSFPSAGGGGGQAGAGMGGQPEGGQGGVAPPSCDDCPDDAPICHDEACVSACPGALARCHTVADPDAADVCCGEGEQCCAALDNGYPHDVCSPQIQPCPTLCADGTTFCNGLCMLEPQTGQYSCVESCSSEATCGDECCPLGSRCTNGACALPDITIDATRVASSAHLDYATFGPNSCAIVEGCIGAPGARTLLRFDLRTPNEGDGDLFMGDPTTQTELFEYSPCHDHFHFTTYAEYRLLDAQNQVVANGHKQAFCLIDIEQFDPNANPDDVYDCGYQGIQAGWADVYHSQLPCQWVDVTGVPPGDYLLEVSLNTAQVLAESDYGNNLATVPVTIPVDSCPGGCTPFDATCCQPGDPCNLAGDGACNCGGLQPWDAADCASCFACEVSTTCPGGCTEQAGSCCTSANSCNKANDGVCDCQGAFAWDAADCDNCISADPTCPPANSCPSGCTAFNPNDPCCGPSNVCGWDNDGWCDCGGPSWDFVDCFSCACN